MITFTATLYNGRDVPRHSRDIFTPEWADKLYRGIARNFDKPFRFVCVTDEPESAFAEPIETLGFENYRHNMWCIIECLRVTGDPVIFMGLDTIITGNITHMADLRPRFAMLRDPYHEKRMCSGVMVWREARDIYDRFVADQSKADYTLANKPSDMRWLHQNGRPDMDLETALPGQIRSYKVHCKDGPGDARIVYFHGVPKPHELNDWTRDHWI